MSNNTHCPKCNSIQVTAQKKGFSAGKAVGGVLLTGGIGLLAGLHGSSDIEITCLACGEKWTPDQLREKQLQEKRAAYLKDHKKWQKEFYSAYEQKDFDTATKIYNVKFQFFPKIPDVHVAYKDQKSKDRSIVIIATVLFSLLAVGLYFVIRWVS